MPTTVDLWSVFERLTAHQRHVVFEMYWNGHNREEYAEVAGVSHQAVSQTLAAAGRTFERITNLRLAKTKKVSVFTIDAEKQGDERGNGQSPDTNKAPASLGPPASLCPQPDTYYGTPDRDAFVKELSWCAASPFMQLQGRGGYNERARLNRERIARDREEREAERRELQAA